MIRKHNEQDLEAILKVWKDSSKLAHPFLDAAFVKKVKTDMRRLYIPGSDTWVYEKEGKVLGFISMIDNEIGGLFVSPEHHSKGMGSELLDFVRPFYEVLEVEVFKKNKIGRSFYDKKGFSLQKKYLHEPSGEEVLRLIQ